MDSLGIDLSPLLAILLLQFTNQFVGRSRCWRLARAAGGERDARRG